MRGNDIYINEGNVDTYERSETFRRSNVPPERFAQTALADVPGKPSLFRTEVVTNPNKFIKPMLVKNGNYMQIAETTEENNDIIKNAHDTKLTGHQGIFKTMKRIQEKTTWKNIKADVEKYIKNCPICAIGKHDRSRKKKLHQFLQPPKKKIRNLR